MVREHIMLKFSRMGLSISTTMAANPHLRADRIRLRCTTSTKIMEDMAKLRVAGFKLRGITSTNTKRM